MEITCPYLAQVSDLIRQFVVQCLSWCLDACSFAALAEAPTAADAVEVLRQTAPNRLDAIFAYRWRASLALWVYGLCAVAVNALRAATAVSSNDLQQQQPFSQQINGLYRCVGSHYAFHYRFLCANCHDLPRHDNARRYCADVHYCTA